MPIGAIAGGEAAAAGGAEAGAAGGAGGLGRIGNFLQGGLGGGGGGGGKKEQQGPGPADMAAAENASEHLPM